MAKHLWQTMLAVNQRLTLLLHSEELWKPFPGPLHLGRVMCLSSGHWNAKGYETQAHNNVQCDPPCSLFSLSAFWNVASQVNPEKHILKDVNDSFSMDTYLINSVEPSEHTSLSLF